MSLKSISWPASPAKFEKAPHALSAACATLTLLDPLAPLRAINSLAAPAPLVAALNQVGIRSEFDSRAVEAMRKEVTPILEKIRTCPEISALYDRASTTTSLTPTGLATGAYTITVTPILDHEFGADCSNTARVIRVDSNLSSDQRFSVAVFELTNAVAAPHYEQIEQDLYRGRIGPNEYAFETERHEFIGAQLHHTLIKSAIVTMHLDSGLDEYSRLEGMSFETHWEGIKDTPHAECYRMDAKRLKIGWIMEALNIPLTDIKELVLGDNAAINKIYNGKSPEQLRNWLIRYKVEQVMKEKKMSDYEIDSFKRLEDTELEQFAKMDREAIIHFLETSDLFAERF